MIRPQIPTNNDHFQSISSSFFHFPFLISEKDLHSYNYSFITTPSEVVSSQQTAGLGYMLKQDVVNCVAENFHQVQVPLYCRKLIFDRINFHQYGKGRHVLYVIVNSGQKIHGTKFHQQDQMAKLAKFSPGENLSIR